LLPWWNKFTISAPLPLNKKTLSDTDICDKFITPAQLQSRLWFVGLGERLTASNSTQAHLVKALP
jgi:hypothetical protein